MKSLRVDFAVDSPLTVAFLSQWEQAIEGHGVTVAWHPWAHADQQPWLSLLWACGISPGQAPSRWACEQVLRREATDTPQDMLARLRPRQDPADDAVQRQVLAHVHKDGAPALPVVTTPDGRRFVGLDGLAALRAHLAHH